MKVGYSDLPGMKRYLLSVYQPDGPAPAPAVLDAIRNKLDELNRDLGAANAWVFSGGLHPPSTATVIRAKSGEMLITDGPFAEAKEHLGGFTIIKVPDLDAALAWGKRLADATGLPIEVRPFQGEVDS